IEVLLHSVSIMIDGEPCFHITAVKTSNKSSGKLQKAATKSSSAVKGNSGQKKKEDELKLLAQLVEQTSDVLTAADSEFRPLTWNSAAERVYGLKREEVLGKDLSTLI